MVSKTAPRTAMNNQRKTVEAMKYLETISDNLKKAGLEFGLGFSRGFRGATRAGYAVFLFHSFQSANVASAMVSAD
jgi:hypothetical protein